MPKGKKNPEFLRFQVSMTLHDAALISGYENSKQIANTQKTALFKMKISYNNWSRQNTKPHGQRKGKTVHLRENIDEHFIWFLQR